MTQIAVYRHIGRVRYDSFAEVVEDLTSEKSKTTNMFTGEESNELFSYIWDIVHYNVCYRDLFRTGGIEAVITKMCEEAPAFEKEKQTIAQLRESSDKWEPFGDYDIQALSTEDTFEVMGVKFNGLNDVWDAVCQYLSSRNYYYTNEDGKPRQGIHVLCNYEKYPKFDIYDMNDNRAYKNFFFKDCGFSAIEMKRIMNIYSRHNYFKAHENLKTVGDWPILYHNGDSASMLLVTPKR